MARRPLPGFRNTHSPRRGSPVQGGTRTVIIINDKLTVASIGVGGRGTAIGMQATDLGNMVACADVDLKNAERFSGLVAKKGGACKVYQDYRKVLDRKDVEAITCGTRDHWHVKVAVDAMLADEDVYCEKPLTLTIEESKLICEAVKKTGRVCRSELSIAANLLRCS